MAYGPILRNPTEALTRRIPRLILPTFAEDWRDNFLDVSKWTYSIGASSGSVTVDVTTPGAAGFPGGVAVGSGATNGGAATLSTIVPVFAIQHGQTALTTIAVRSVLEFDFRFNNITNFDNTTFFVGLTPNTASDRTTNGILGCFLSSDALTLISDNAGTETTQATTDTITLNNTTHKAKLTLDRATGLQLSIDEVVEATITTNIDNAVRNAKFFSTQVKNDNAAAANLYIGRVRSWLEDIA